MPIYRPRRQHRLQGLLATLMVLMMVMAAVPPATLAQPTQPTTINAPLPLTAYPRPGNDNGLGIHWSTNVYGQPAETVDFFVRELKTMGVKWVKFLNDETEGRHNEYLIQQLVANDIMPVMRIYHECNKALDLESLRRMVQHYVPQGLFYYELYNEPDLRGIPGGWCNNETPDPERIARYWISAARVIQQAGGYPGLPSFFPPALKDPNWRDSFFMRFFGYIQAWGETSVLHRAWGSVHNYFLNHPVRYPYDEVAQNAAPLTQTEIARYNLTEAEIQSINQARADDRAKGITSKTIDEDPFGFLNFLAYHDRFFELFGFEIPLISTEGGITVGSSEDARYPKVSAQVMAERTLEAATYMLDEAPAYYFSFNSWLLAERAMGNFNPTWETWAWYQGQDGGQHLPVVDWLKAWTRKTETRRNAPRNVEDPETPMQEARLSPNVRPQPTPIAEPAPGLLDDAEARLNSYPRPSNDNGWGIHWVPTLFGQPTHAVDYFLGEIDALGIRWVKIMQQDQTKLEHEYLLRELQRRGIMPILRIYRTHNDPYEHLTELVRAALPLGVYYIELYNEVNVVGAAGGWPDDATPTPERIIDNWIAAAADVTAAGGFPSLPSLAPGGSVDDMEFLRGMLEAIKARGRLDVLTRAWIPLHNYFLNHPPDYPYDAVNQAGQQMTQIEVQQRILSDAQVQEINQARATGANPGATIYDDSNGFYKFAAYDRIVFESLGTHLPIISTEGGVVVGTHEDPRYPPTTDQDLTEWTVYAFEVMAKLRPNYYFAFTPWIIANYAGYSRSGVWENAAWYYDTTGRTRPVVPAIKRLAATLGMNNLSSTDIKLPGPALALPQMAPGQMAIANYTAQITATTAALTATLGLPVAWDSRLTALEITVERPAVARWRLVKAEYWDGQQSDGRHHIYVDLLDENGQRIAGPTVRIEWRDGYFDVVSALQAAATDYPANFPMYAAIGAYSASVLDGASDKVVGMGLPDNHHVSFILTFQRVNEVPPAP